MKIRTKLEIGTIIVLIAMITIGFILFLTALKIDNATQDEKTTIEIIQNTIALRSSTFEYFLNPSEQKELEWDSKNHALSNTLIIKFENPQDQIILENIRQNNIDLQSDFKKIVELSHSGNSLNQEQSLKDHLLLKLQSILDKSFTINEHSQSEIEATERQTNAFIFIFIGIMGMFIVLASFFMRKSITEPISKLFEGTKNISNGDLGFRIIKYSHDEIGELAKAFDSMTIKLREFYNVLEKKVRERTKELLEKNNLFQSLIDNLPIGVALIKKSHGKIVMMNKAGVELLGQNIDPKINKNKYTEKYHFEHEDGSPYHIEKLPQNITLKNSKIITKDDIVVQRPNGTKITLRVTSAPVKNTKNKLASVVVIFEDITAKKEVENMKNQFLSFAAHQLRTPLGSIRWNLEMLLNGEIGKLPDMAHDRLQQINESNQRMIGLVNELLEVSLIGQGKENSNSKLTDIMPIIENSIREVDIDARVKNINITLKLPSSTVPQIMVDPTRFHEVITNLLLNSIKYNQKNGKVTISLKENRKKLNITITDTGIGIPLNEQSKIFSKFFRAKNAILAETEGTGLGLFMIKSYIEKWGGEISIESEEGKFTTYNLEFNIP